MSLNNCKVKESEIDDLIKNADINFKTIYGKCTLCTCKLEDGFTLVTSSGAVNEENYDFEIGKESCLEDIKDQLWKLEGYALAKNVYETKQMMKKMPDMLQDAMQKAWDRME